MLVQLEGPPGQFEEKNTKELSDQAFMGIIREMNRRLAKNQEEYGKITATRTELLDELDERIGGLY